MSTMIWIEQYGQEDFRCISYKRLPKWSHESFDIQTYNNNEYNINKDILRSKGKNKIKCDRKWIKFHFN